MLIYNPFAETLVLLSSYPVNMHHLFSLSPVTVNKERILGR